MQNLTDKKINTYPDYQFCYISQEQIDSFALCFLNIEGEKVDVDICDLHTEKRDQPGTDQHPFQYWVIFKVPIVLELTSEMHYTLKYRYKNYEQSCYITYSLPCITKSFQEIYSLIGRHAYDYQIHAFAYTPYKRTIDSKNLVQWLNAATLSIRWDN